MTDKSINEKEAVQNTNHSFAHAAAEIWSRPQSIVSAQMGAGDKGFEGRPDSTMDELNKEPQPGMENEVTRAVAHMQASDLFPLNNK